MRHTQFFVEILMQLIYFINICDFVQGWEQCVCLDMNAFYLGLVPEVERCRVETLEPFDEYEVSYVCIIFFL